MFCIAVLDTNYSRTPTGWIDEDFEEFIKKWELVVVEHNEGIIIVHADWGNGEGHDSFEITFDTELQEINIQLPSNLLWKDTNPQNYDTKATEQNFSEALEAMLMEANYKASIQWDEIPEIVITPESQSDLNSVKSIISTLDFDYIPVENS